MKALKDRNFRLSIRTRFFILLLVLTILPFLAYRFAIDLHEILLEDQATIQKQTVVNLSLILENRTDLWAQQIQSGNPTDQLAHLNLQNSVLWIVNEYGLTTYVVGSLPKENDYPNDGLVTYIGRGIIKTFATLLPFSLPTLYPQTSTPEKTLIRRSLRGEIFQQYRADISGRPISLMSASPLRVNGRILGSLVLEQKMTTLLGESLNNFYRLVGIAALVFLVAILGAIFHIAALSNRILRLDTDVRRTFINTHGQFDPKDFPDRYQRAYHDELSDLRHHIYEMLQQLASYERYLKQFPKALRHELHNPLNRLAMSLSILGDEVEHKQLNFAQHALDQLKQIIASLTEATSIEDSLSIQTPEPFPIGLMLNHYMENTVSQHQEIQFSFQSTLPEDIEILGDGFMMEQLLDKLISNAKDFSDLQQPILIKASRTSNFVFIQVRNSGPCLPEGLEERVFDGMTSIRQPNEDNQAHLGLGLYIVKLIAEYHQGVVSAKNIENEDYHGVEFQLKLPILKT